MGKDVFAVYSLLATVKVSAICLFAWFFSSLLL